MSLVHTEIDQTAVLKALNLNISDPKTQAVLLICQRYNLDPVLKHVVLVSGNTYITRDGLLSVAHSSGQFDGIDIVEEGETPTHWWARAAVYRKDMGRPFTYRGRYPKKGGNQGYGPEMAVKCAEVMALRRAFNVTGVAAREEAWDTADSINAAAAKNRLLAAAEGDKDAAAEAWRAAGLEGRSRVSEDDVAAAVLLLDQPDEVEDVEVVDEDPPAELPLDEDG